MIQVGIQKRDPSSFVENILELHERLGRHIGSVFSIEVDPDQEERIRPTYTSTNTAPPAKRTVTIGKLERVKLSEGRPGRIGFSYCFEGDSVLREDLQLSTSRVKVLLSGEWKVLHEPEAWWEEDQKREEEALAKRLAVTPKSQWTEEERLRMGEPSNFSYLSESKIDNSYGME